MDIKGTKIAIKRCMAYNLVPYLHGSQGVGKTETVERVAAEISEETGEEWGFVSLHLATQGDVGDLIGLASKDENGRTFHCRPEWMPTKGKGIIFLDEFNRAHPDILQVMLPFTLTKKIHTHALPEGWKIVAAGNYSSNNFNVTDISDSALLSRFVHLDFQPTAEEFISYVESKEGDVVADWLRNDSAPINRKETLDMSIVRPDNRKIEKALLPLSKDLVLLEPGNEGLRHEILEGCVGTSAAVSFLAFEKDREKTLKAMDILSKYNESKQKIKNIVGDGKDTRLDILSKVVDEILAKLEAKPKLLSENPAYVENFKAFILDSPLELGLKIFNTFKKNALKFDKKNEILNNPAFVAMVAKKYEGKRDELVATQESLDKQEDEE